MKTTLFFFSGIFVHLACLAQTGQTTAGALTKTQRAGDALLSEPIRTPLSGEIYTPTADLKWLPGLKHIADEPEPQEPDHDKLEAIRTRIMALKMSRADQLHVPGTINKISSVTPTIGYHFDTNKNDGWNPLDNNIAISDKGIIISVANDTFEINDTTGTSLYYNTLNTFIGDNTIVNVCDPVVLYDKQADRFIFYCQEITSPADQPNHMLVFFSKTNNPVTGGWNYFKLSGDPVGDGSWADYPKIAVSDKDLFIASNLFNSSGSFKQAIVWQIQKSTGYSGGTLNSKLWSGITGTPFTLLPVSEGQGNPIGPGCWMVSASSSGSSSLNLYHITDDATGSPVLNYYNVATTAYTAAGNSMQMGTTATLKITDCRVLSGFILNNIIHFVFNSADASGNTGINYNRLDITAKTNVSKLFVSGNTDYGYPAVASYTASGVQNDKSVMIGFSEANSGIYPKIEVVNCDDAMNFSAITVVKNSLGYVKGSGVQRWGDYSGMCRRHNSPQACVWMAGSYGSASNLWVAYAAQIYDAGFATAVTNTSTDKKVTLYPNPVVDMYTLQFDLSQDSKVAIQVYNAMGQLVQELYSGFCHAGENTFSFNKANLSAGTYFIEIRIGSNQVVHKSIVVSK